MHPPHPGPWEAKILEFLIRSGRVTADQARLLPPEPDSGPCNPWGPRVQHLLNLGLIDPEQVQDAVRALEAGHTQETLLPERMGSDGSSSSEGGIQAPLPQHKPRRPRTVLPLDPSQGETAWNSTPEAFRWEHASLIGVCVGNFRIVNLLDQGGMGLIFEGHDEKLDRTVALKCIHADKRSHASARARFLREARVLSQLNHPNICQIFEFIEGEEIDFLVLERIQGTTLRKVLRQPLPQAERWSIAGDLLQALVAAHSKGIIHRDLKPGNIMVTDAKQVKVLDFGLARYLQDEAGPARTDRSPDPSWKDQAPRDPTPADATTIAPEPDPASNERLTHQGAILGTPAYMSPEQARGESGDSASDMFAVGLILREVFTGVSPTDPGPPPALASDTPESFPELNQLDPDLNALLRRLIAFEPAKRPTALDAAEKLAWIQGKPKRRRRRQFILATLTLLLMLVGALTLQTWRAVRAQQQARTEAATAKIVTDFLLGLFATADPQEGTQSTVTARELLDHGVENAQHELKDRPEVQASILETMGIAYHALGLHPKAQTLLEDARRIREQRFGPDHPDVAKSLLHLGNIYDDQAKHAEAERLLRKSLAIREQHLDPKDPQLVSNLTSLGMLCYHKGDQAQAEQFWLRGLRLSEEVQGPDHPNVATCLANLGVLYSDQGAFARAEPLYLRSLRIREKNLGPEHPRIASILFNLGILYMEQGQPAKAEPLFLKGLHIREKALGPNHPQVASGLFNLAALYVELRQYSRAEPLYAQSLRLWEQSLGPEHPDVATNHNNLGVLFFKQGRYDRAENHYRRALGIQEKRLGKKHPDVAITLYNLAAVHGCLGRRSIAMTCLQRAVAIAGDAPWTSRLKQDPDFAPLHGYAEFEKLAEALATKAATAPQPRSRSNP